MSTSNNEPSLEDSEQQGRKKRKYVTIDWQTIETCPTKEEAMKFARNGVQYTTEGKILKCSYHTSCLIKRKVVEEASSWVVYQSNGSHSASIRMSRKNTFPKALHDDMRSAFLTTAKPISALHQMKADVKHDKEKAEIVYQLTGICEKNKETAKVGMRNFKKGMKNTQKKNLELEDIQMANSSEFELYNQKRWVSE